ALPVAPTSPPTDPAPKLVSENTATHWPDMGQMLGSLFVCELPSPPKASPEASPQSITVLGLGLHPHTLPAAHHQLIHTAQVLAGGQALLNRFPEAPAERIPLSAALDTALMALEQRYYAGQSVVVLADGDPLFFGIGATLARRLGPQALRIFPAVSSLQEACARLALPWHDVACVSLHGRNSFHALNGAVIADKHVCLLTDARYSPDKIARHLLDRGVDWFDAHIFENLNGPNEQHHHLPLREVVGNAFGPVATLLLIPARPPRRPASGIPDAALATEGGLLTKGPVRAAALALLRVHPHHTVWDVGAGSGAVSLEASALAHQGCVVAFERDSGRALCIKENRRRFGAANLEIITGEAPQCLYQLPTPDRIFVGGGLNGDAAHDILTTLTEALPAGGRLVISCVLLGSLHLACEFLRQRHWPVEITALQASQSVPLAGDLRFNALNPVFLVSTEKACRQDGEALHPHSAGERNYEGKYR
ncbi:MAG: precorrin-6y C5,15-methyltransferase (decarboxylating) subunit CbiE, partial [Desulfovibrionaceae bacterium]